MKVSYFNFSVGVWCAATALFISVNSGEPTLVAINIVLALYNLWLGMTMHKTGN